MHENPKQNGDFATAEALEAAFDWWLEAGVDMDFSDAPANWLAEPEAEEAVAAPKPVKRIEEPKQTPVERAFEGTAQAISIGGDQASWPDDLAKFREWWLSEPSLSHARVEDRLPPRGVAKARLMVIVAEPYGDDADELLSGGAGRFAGAILRAMGIDQHEAYLASALPAPSSFPDWSALASSGLSQVLANHIKLAEPERVLVFGRGLAPLFGIDAAQAREASTLDLSGRTVPVLLAPDFAELSRSPQRRRNFWNRWLEWTQ